jgi:hypothetical protein
MKHIWKIQTVYDSADTCRDKEELHYDILGYTSNIHEALYIANEFIIKGHNLGKLCIDFIALICEQGRNMDNLILH